MDSPGAVLEENDNEQASSISLLNDNTQTHTHEDTTGTKTAIASLKDLIQGIATNSHLSGNEYIKHSTGAIPMSADINANAN